MAESVVSVVLPRLATWVEQEVELLRGVEDEVKDIQSELLTISAFLRDADGKSESNAGVKQWVKEVRDVAYEIEDVLDGLLLGNRYNAHLANSRDVETNGCCLIIRGMIDFFRGAKHQIESLKEDHNIGTKIKAIKVRIDRISHRRKRFELSSTEPQGSTSNGVSLSAMRDPREDALFLEESQLVGIDGPRNKLIMHLVDKDAKLRVVSVYGMGGLGKTTLVKKVYDHQRLKNKFPLHRAWITVSQTFDAKDLLRRLIQQLVGQLDGLDQMMVTEMKQTLNDKLRGKRYVVVLDDIWNSNAWKGFKNALPDDNRGSRIIITTRSENIADEACIGGYGLKYPLQPLNFEDSRKLFYKKAFNSNVPQQSSNDSCLKFLKKCNGLPLGIVAIAGLLSKKKLCEWDQVYQSLGTLMDGSIEQRLNDLRLVISYSYNDLPCHLKPCFLYMSIFPEDYSIQCSRLFRLWAAEGFVLVDRRSVMNFTKEEVAKIFLEELIQRSLVQVENLNDRRRVKSCKLHDLVREFIIGKANTDNFVTVTSEDQNNDWRSSGQPPRRLSVGTQVSYNGNKSAIDLRSLFLFHNFQGIWEELPRFKFLKVLDVQTMRIGESACAVGSLSNLRYLGLGYCEMRDVNTLFGKLKHLETLVFKGRFCGGDVFSAILQMRLLRNFIISGAQLPVGIHQLTLLEKLGLVDLSGEKSGLFVSMLGKMTQLRKLAVCGLKQENEMRLFASVGKMRYLQTFKVTAISPEYKFLHSGSISSPPPSLNSLYIRGALNPLPFWISSLQNLEKLVLHYSYLKDDPMEQLRLLPSLVTLKLLAAFIGEKLYIRKGGFPSLKKLFLLDLWNLNEVKVEEGAMPALESISHGRCNNVKFDVLMMNNITPLKIFHIKHLQ